MAMRRGAAIAAIGLLVLAVGVARAGEKKVVRIWHTETEPQTVAAMQEIANEFEKLHPDINIRQEGLAWGDLEPKLTAALAAGAPPEASHGQAFTCASFYHKGLLRDQEDIANAIGKNNIFEVARNLCRFDGKYYGVTHSPNTNLLIYRKDIFKAKGLKPPETGTNSSRWRRL
jgi:multiple sugar transport system substrate-binding protein